MAYPNLIFRFIELMNDEAKGKNIVISVVVPSKHVDTPPQNRKSIGGGNLESCQARGDCKM